jgi:hypothetical protein
MAVNGACFVAFTVSKLAFGNSGFLRAMPDCRQYQVFGAAKNKGPSVVDECVAHTNYSTAPMGVIILMDS